MTRKVFDSMEEEIRLIARKQRFTNEQLENALQSARLLRGMTDDSAANSLGAGIILGIAAYLCSEPMLAKSHAPLSPEIIGIITMIHTYDRF